MLDCNLCDFITPADASSWCDCVARAIFRNFASPSTVSVVVDFFFSQFNRHVGVISRESRGIIRSFINILLYDVRTCLPPVSRDTSSEVLKIILSVVCVVCEIYNIREVLPPRLTRHLCAILMESLVLISRCLFKTRPVIKENKYNRRWCHNKMTKTTEHD